MTAEPAKSDPNPPPKKDIEREFQEAGDEVTKPGQAPPQSPGKRGDGDPDSTTAPGTKPEDEPAPTPSKKQEDIPEPSHTPKPDDDPEPPRPPDKPTPPGPPTPKNTLSEQDKLFPPASVEAVERREQEQGLTLPRGYGLG